jgi:sigma-B regulation protein RsbU (phosphoserine phosphatase)
MDAASPIRALVVDDDPVLLRLITHFLQRRGYAVEHREDGVAALERVRAGGINLVVTDRNMPLMDGLELCRAMRALNASTYVYCIMLTASNEPQSLVVAMEAGVDDFIAKPLNLAELGARLRAAERVLTLEAGLARRNAQLADAYGQLQRELELARTLQVGQLPPPAPSARCTSTGASRPRAMSAATPSTTSCSASATCASTSPTWRATGWRPP